VRSLYPPGAMKDSRGTGRHEYKWNSATTLERQNTEPNPLVENFNNFRFNAPQPPIPRPLWAPGRGKAAGTKRVLGIGINKNGR
jgi:hypothetical protein